MTKDDFDNAALDMQQVFESPLLPFYGTSRKIRKAFSLTMLSTNLVPMYFRYQRGSVALAHEL